MIPSKTQIIELLSTNDRAVARALVVLNNRQTDDEQAASTTRYRNGRGFNAAHAKRGTGMAQFFLRTGFLTPKQLAWWRGSESKGGTMRIALYANQLVEEAELKQARVPAKV